MQIEIGQEARSSFDKFDLEVPMHGSVVEQGEVAGNLNANQDSVCNFELLGAKVGSSDNKNVRLIEDVSLISY